MAERVPAEVFPPGELVKDELEARGWSQADLAEILGRPPRLVSEIVTGKRSVTPETARGLAAAFGTDPQLWMNLESAYQLSRVKLVDDAVARRARLYERFPIKELVRRRWVEPTNSIDVLEQRVRAFFGIGSLDEELTFSAAARSSIAPSAAQCAWVVRVRELARAVPAAQFTSSSVDTVCDKLRPLLQHVPELRHVPRVLSDAGIRLVVVEPIPQSRIDGACLWLDDTSPVLALSLRYDRIDSFWFTLMHELGHVKRGDGKVGVALDVDLVGDRAQKSSEKSETERLADEFSSEFIVPDREFRNFVARTRPLYSKLRIKGFATRLRVHPGLVVGRLQHMDEISFAHNREMLDKVRSVVVPVSLTDGWGSTVSTSRGPLS
jgi:HTH-type transcriptional regulator/antitoxin HigA